MRRAVLDVLKPHDPGMVEFSRRTSEIEGVEGVNAVLVENDEDVENIKLTVEGDGFDLSGVRQEIEELGGSIHSVDEAVFGEKTVEQSSTPQD
jgi:hypothetical protein